MLKSLSKFGVLMITALAHYGSAKAQSASRPVKLEVDLRDATKRVYHAKMEFPAKPGPFTLVYPKWIPGEHAPNGPIVDVTGLHFRADGKELSWRRDEVDMFAFHLSVPAGSKTLEASLDYLLPSDAAGTEAPVATAQIAVLPWNLVVLYPQASKSDDVLFSPSVRLPENWKYATALEPAPGAKSSDATAAFETVSLTTLIDS